MGNIRALLLVSSAVCTMAFATFVHAVDPGGVISERVKKLTHAVKWTQVAAIPNNFDTHHPQTGNRLRAYFMAEDEKSTLYIYEAEVK